MKTSTPPKWWTVSDIADYYETSQTTVYRLIESGKITGFKIGRSWRFDPEEVRNSIERLARGEFDD